MRQLTFLILACTFFPASQYHMPALGEIMLPTAGILVQPAAVLRYVGSPGGQVFYEAETAGESS